MHNHSEILTQLQSPIKWPGGKSKEYPYIQRLIPDFERYIEPFFGGGAIFFKLSPKQAIVNDFSSDLMQFYRFLKGDLDANAFHTELLAYANNWDKISAYIQSFGQEITSLYTEYRLERINTAQLAVGVELIIKKQQAAYSDFFTIDFCLDTDNLLARIISNVIAKLQRVKTIEARRGDLGFSGLEDNIETAFRSGFYMHFRDILNGVLYTKQPLRAPINEAKRIANYYFIREFCYGAMFRFNASGHFNIPYGGIAYNKKDFRKKIAMITSDDYRRVLANTTLENGDFSEVFQKHAPTERDFIFLDPPYDSDFSDYDNQVFGSQDHIRLAETLHATTAKYLLLIKETPFIRSLYDDKSGVTIESFEKRYLYNVKGRNNQQAQHLIIYNY